MYLLLCIIYTHRHTIICTLQVLIHSALFFYNNTAISGSHKMNLFNLPYWTAVKKYEKAGLPLARSPFPKFFWFFFEECISPEKKTSHRRQISHTAQQYFQILHLFEFGFKRLRNTGAPLFGSSVTF